MKLFQGMCVGAIVGTSLLLARPASACTEINAFDGLIFDAGSFPAKQNMETYLDKALTYGVEKVVLFPHPDVTKGNHPHELEEIFPDLVVRGTKPWSKSPPIVWPEPMNTASIGSLEAELERYSDRLFLLGGLSRFDMDYLHRLARDYKNLWFGFGVSEIDPLLETCGGGPWGKLMDVAKGRYVFASFGQNNSWKSYRKTVKKLKKLANLMAEEKANALAFRNAESLYNLAVNAP